MKKSIISLPKEKNDKLKQIYANSPMREWMLRYERISHHELAKTRNAKKQITNRSYGKIGI